MKNKIVTVVFCIFLVLFMLTFCIGLPIYCRFFYYIQIKTLKLEELSGFSYDVIKTAYDEVLDFCTLPWVNEFSAGELKFSAEGAAHFADCKGLFIFDFAVMLISAIALTSIMVLHMRKVITLVKFKSHNAYFYSAIVSIVVPVVLAALISIDFDKAFQIFHTIFFPGKTNWVFDWYEDEIIRVMPEQFFMNCAIIIGVALVAFSATLITADLVKYRKQKPETEQTNSNSID